MYAYNWAYRPHSCLSLYLASGFWRFLSLYNIQSKYSIVKIYGYFFHILSSVLSRAVTIGVWQTDWLDFIGISLCAKNYQSIHKFSRIMGNFAIIFWPRHCLGQGKVAFGNFFIWTLSILKCIQIFLSKYSI